MRFQLATAGRAGLVGFERQREWPDAYRVPGGEFATLTTEHFGFANDATVDPEVLEGQQAVVATDDSLSFAHQGALQHHGVAIITSNSNHRIVGFDQRAATVMNLVEPDFHGAEGPQ